MLALGAGLALLACAPEDAWPPADTDEEEALEQADDGVWSPALPARATGSRGGDAPAAHPVRDRAAARAPSCAAYCEAFDHACGDGATWPTLEHCEARCHEELRDDVEALACRAAWLREGDPACIAASLGSPICDALAS